MSSLYDILESLKIKSRRDFDLFLKNLPPDSPLKLVNKTNINDETEHFFDYTENRVYEEKVVFKNAVIDIDNLWLTDSVKVSFINCIVLKKVIIGTKDPKLRNIYIDNCIFMDELYVQSIQTLSNIDIYNSNIRCLFISNVNVSDSVFFSSNNIQLLSIKDSRFNVFDAIKNSIKYFESVDNSFGKLYFGYTQLQLKNIKNTPRLKNYFLQYKKHSVGNAGFSNTMKLYGLKLYKLLFISDINLFRLNKDSASELAAASELYENDYSIIKTIDYLKNNTTISSNRTKYNKIMYYEALFSQKGLLPKFFTWLCGGFVRPSRFIIMAVLVFIIFANLYMLPGLGLEYKGHPMGFNDALYFSGTTLLTIGYGDISPKGHYARMLTIMEGAFGILTINAFLIALVRKYID